MSDSYIGLPEDGAGKKLDAEQLSVGANTVLRERDQIAGAGADDIAVVTDSDPAANDHGLVSRIAGPVSPQLSTDSIIALAAGASDNLDSAQIASGKTAKLCCVEVSSSVPIKAVIKKVADGVETTVAVRFGWQGLVVWTAPHKEFVKVAQSAVASFDGFRVSVTNLTAGFDAADIYASFYYDEVA